MPGIGIFYNKIKKMDNQTWQDLFKKYNSNITDKEIDYILWNKTCYPFDDPTTIKQIEKYFTTDQLFSKPENEKEIN